MTATADLLAFASADTASPMLCAPIRCACSAIRWRSAQQAQQRPVPTPSSPPPAPWAAAAMHG